VLYAEKDFNLPKHPEIDVPNLEVIKLMQSFKSKEYVTERYAWRHFYWCASHTLSDELSALCSLVLLAAAGGSGGWLTLQATFESAFCGGFIRSRQRSLTSSCHPSRCSLPRLLPTRRFLTDSGIEYLREFLNLPSEIVPATLKKSTRPLERGDARGPRRDGPPRRFGGEREGGERGGYRSEKTGSGAPGEFRPEFRGGGFGRGSAPQ
jgi:hypothetical protein